VTGIIKGINAKFNRNRWISIKFSAKQEEAALFYSFKLVVYKNFRPSLKVAMIHGNSRRVNKSIAHSSHD
jgi:hypothetical protein